MNKSMRTVTIFKNGEDQTVRLPFDMEYQEVSELEIERLGDTITLRPRRPSWTSFGTEDKADPDFMSERKDVIEMDERFK